MRYLYRIFVPSRVKTTGNFHAAEFFYAIKYEYKENLALNNIPYIVDFTPKLLISFLPIAPLIAAVRVGQSFSISLQKDSSRKDTIESGSVVFIEDSLSIALTSFSHFSEICSVKDLVLSSLEFCSDIELVISSEKSN